MMEQGALSSVEEQQPSKLQVEGSNPSERANFKKNNYKFFKNSENSNLFNAFTLFSQR